MQSLLAALDSQIKSISTSPLQRAQYALQKRAILENEPTVETFMAPLGGVAGPAADNTSYITVLAVLGVSLLHFVIIIWLLNAIHTASLQSRIGRERLVFRPSASMVANSLTSTSILRTLSHTQCLTQTSFR
jgi:hypothetical protein